MATRQKQILIGTLVALIVLAALACCTLFASLSSASDLFCYEKFPTIDLTFKPSDGVSGQLKPIAMPRSSTQPVLTDVFASIGWNANQDSSLALYTLFNYDAQLSQEYPIFKIRYEVITNNQITSSNEVDYTIGCTNPTAVELFAGSSFRSEDKVVRLIPGQDNRVHVQIWAGRY